MRLISEIVVRFDCSELMSHLEMLRALGESCDTKENKLLALKKIFFCVPLKGLSATVYLIAPRWLVWRFSMSPGLLLLVGSINHVALQIRGDISIMFSNKCCLEEREEKGIIDRRFVPITNLYAICFRIFSLAKLYIPC